MKPLVACLALAVLVAAFLLGWQFAPSPPASLAILAGRSGAPAAIQDPASAARLDVALLARNLAAPAVAPNAFDETVARPAAFRPIDPDLAYNFRRQLSAVVAQPGGGTYALLRDEGGARTLRPGEVFQNNWRLARLSLGEAVFARGRETRTVGLFDPPAAAPAPPPQEPAQEPAAASSTPEGAAPPPLA